VTEIEQHPVIKRLLGLLKNMNISVMAWVLLHYVNLGVLNENLNTVGIFTNKGKKAESQGFSSI